MSGKEDLIFDVDVQVLVLVLLTGVHQRLGTSMDSHSKYIVFALITELILLDRLGKNGLTAELVGVRDRKVQTNIVLVLQPFSNKTNHIRSGGNWHRL